MIEYQRVGGDNDWNGLYVCTTWGRVPEPRFERMVRQLVAWAAQTGLRFAFKDWNGKSGVADGHNKLIERFLQTDFEWLLHLDGDCIITPMHVEKLASWQAPFVTALTLRRKPPYTPTIYRKRNEQGWLQDFDWIRDWLYEHLEWIDGVDYAPLIAEPKGWPLRQVERCGSHCLLVHRSVIEAIDPPWYEALHDSGSGSDFDFCAKAIEAGVEVTVDLAVIAGHLQGDYCTGPLDWLVWDKMCDYDETDKRLAIRLGGKNE